MQDLTPIEILVDADIWQIGDRMKFIFYIFYPSVQKRSRATD